MLTADDRKQFVDLLYQACRENKVLEPFPVVHAVKQLVEHVDQLEAKIAKVREWAEFFTPETVGERELWSILEWKP